MTHNPLDSFESALLTELRQHATQPALTPVPVRRRRRRIVAIVATGIAASVAGVVGLSGAGGSPAYAVAVDGDGDVVVTVHRLDDASGLEKALRAKGIDADVSYDADGSNGPTTVGVGPDGEPVIGGELPDPPAGAATEQHGSLSSGTSAGGEDEASTVTSGQGTPPAGDPCGFEAGSSPADLVQDGSDWVLTIPAGSPLMDRHVTIGTDASGGLSVLYAGDEGGSFCGVAQMQAAPKPAS